VSGSNSQEEYINSLKRIKETEGKVQDEIEYRKNQVEQEIKNLQIDLNNTIEILKRDGEQMVEKSIEDARDKAIMESAKIIDDSTNNSKSISFQPNKQVIKEIMDIVFSEIKGDKSGDYVT
jgi:V/A-type H+-transporting ATPase subunit G/H